VRYEHVTTDVNSPQYTQAQSLLANVDSVTEKADFTLTDLTGKSWTLSDLHGKVVLVNFWATWCPPCREEMPYLDTLAHRFASQGLIVLSITDEEREKVASYISSHKINFPILLDPGRKVAEKYNINGIPESFVFDRTGELVAHSFELRTEEQFLQMLSAADLK
jgi:peroxiredoxin